MLVNIVAAMNSKVSGDVAVALHSGSGLVVVTQFLLLLTPLLTCCGCVGVIPPVCSLILQWVTRCLLTAGWCSCRATWCAQIR